MKFSVSRENLLRPLSIVAGAVERRQTMPILSNICFKLVDNILVLTGTDLEVELSAKVSVDVKEGGTSAGTTIPARKVVDICKSLPEGADITFSTEESRVILSSGRSRFTLSTLPAKDFPSVQHDSSSFSVSVNQKGFASLVQKTAFSMAQQDVRYYLNGMLWELDEGQLRAVATDGHRLAVAEMPFSSQLEIQTTQIIIPRKGVLELTKLLSENDDEMLTLEFGSNHIRAATEDLVFVSKLVDGKFPDYRRVLPKGGNKLVVADRQALRSALSRAAILSNEKFRGVRFTLSDGLVSIQANNPEQEEATEEVAVTYSGDGLEMGFNVGYLIDVLGALGHENIHITLTDNNSSALVQDGNESNNARYVVMPMRL